MRSLVRLGVAAVFVLALAVPVGAMSAAGKQAKGEPRLGPHDLSSPLSDAQRELRQQALEMKLQGKIPANAKVGKVAKGQYVQLALEKTDKIFVVIAEFGNNRHPAYPDGDGSFGAPAVEPDGPEHNSIWEPNRAVDNTTLWQSDFDQAHYENMYFSRMAGYYKRQSSGRYTVDGDVTEWVRVPYNEARYGRDPCGSIVCSNTWQLIRHAINTWVADYVAAGHTLQQATDYLKTFDAWDRYDHDGDGNFDEPDGYIDHFQIVHAGGDQAAGDPQQLDDAIWSHRWYVNTPGIGSVGPTVNGHLVPFGGYEIGGPIPASPVIGGPNVTFPTNQTGVWVGDYTIQPENGGLGVFAHEYGHDLALPDLYDTSGNVGGAENSTGFWTLMSSGANIGDGGPDGIGDDPVDFGAWEKFQLGWLNYEVAFAGRKSEHKLGPAETNTKQAQGLFVVLPPKQVVQHIADPFAGSHFYYSGQGDDLDNTMTRSFTLPAGAVTLAAKVNYQIEQDWDYAYLTVNGAIVETNLSTDTDPNGQNFGDGITGTTGGNWVDLTADLSAYAGQTVTLGFRYWTDGAVVEPGFMVDELSVTGSPVDGAETDTGWSFDGFKVTTGTEEAFYFNAYLAENRQYLNDDRSLRTAYNFGFLNARPDWVEHFRYQDGVLISYWDASHTDNGVGDHPGEGLILPIDAHPTFHHWYDNQLIRPRIVSYDSTFGLEPTDAITVHKDSQPTSIPSQPAVPVFDDTKDWWFDCDTHACTGAHDGRYEPGWQGVKAPKTGTLVRVKSLTPGGFAQIEVRPK
jgi:immune inhibitor A